MTRYILKEEQKNSIQGQEFASCQAFSCVQDINDIWYTFLTDDDKRAIIGTRYEWLLPWPKSEYVPPLPINN